jgi:hypothetical protein
VFQETRRRDKRSVINKIDSFHLVIYLIIDLQKLCSTLANVNLCELAEEEDRSSPSRITTSSITPIDSDHQSLSPQFNSTMISGTSHLNELQKENRAPPPPPPSSPSNAILVSPTDRSPSILSNTITTLENCQV